MAGFIKNLKEFNNKLKSTKNLLQKADSVEEQTISEIVTSISGV